MKRALVSGSAGFIGRHMVRELESRGYEVDYIDLLGSRLGGTVLGGIDAAFFESPTVYDLVVHAAYHVGGRAAIDGVNTNFAKNLQLDAAMFEWAVRTKQKRVLYFSSSAAYPVSNQSKEAIDNCALWGVDPRLQEDLIFRNRDTLWGNPDALYGWAKLTGERLAEDARKNGLAVTVVRPFSGYGEDQSADYPFPSIIKRASLGDLTVWGPPGQTRDWIHVSDVVNGSLAVVESGTTDPVNLCTGRGVEMGELACMIFDAELERTNSSDIYLRQPTYDESKPTGVFYRVGDPTRFNQYYTPKISLEEGIQRALKVL